jgi:CRISPR/Cas system-associated exonuclease Cas4 (RecB family)
MTARTRAKQAGKDSRKPLKSWSYSTYTMWKRCAQRIYYSKIEKLPDPLGPAVQRGIEVHDLAEAYVKGKITEFPTKGPGKILIPFTSDLDEVKRHATVQTEVEFTFTKDWKPTHWRDWDNAWVRAKLDVLYRPERNHFVLIDYKTGQVRDYEKQTELYALCCFLKYKSAEEVTTEIWYLDHPDEELAITTYDYSRDELEKLKEEWERLVKPLMADMTYRPYPGADCKWCPFSKIKGGPCEAG